MERSGTPRHAAIEAAKELLDTVGIADLADRKPAELSGGQQQRIGLARALARSARLYLFDEPTAHLDASARVAVQEEIGRRRRDTGAAAVYSTHDSAEALAIADRIAVIRDGSVIQSGSPQEIYERPVDIWAARLTGPAATIDGRIVADTVGGQDNGRANGRAVLVVRPEWVELGGEIRGMVDEVWYRGSHTDYVVETPVGRLTARLPGSPEVHRGESAGWTITRSWIPNLTEDLGSI